MDAEDARPGETTSSRQPLVKTALLVAGFVLAGAVAGAVTWYVLAPSGDHSSSGNADVSGAVKSSMQQAFDTDPRFAPYHLHVEKVDVAKQTGNQYEGIAVVRSAKGIDHDVLVQVTADHQHVTWKTKPDAFALLVMEQFNPTAPTAGLPR
jgi:hypothetical protein